MGGEGRLVARLPAADAGRQEVEADAGALRQPHAQSRPGLAHGAEAEGREREATPLRRRRREGRGGVSSALAPVVHVPKGVAQRRRAEDLARECARRRCPGHSHVLAGSEGSRRWTPLGSAGAVRGTGSAGGRRLIGAVTKGTAAREMPVGRGCAGGQGTGAGRAFCSTPGRRDRARCARAPRFQAQPLLC